MALCWQKGYQRASYNLLIRIHVLARYQPIRVHVQRIFELFTCFAFLNICESQLRIFVVPYLQNHMRYCDQIFTICAGRPVLCVDLSKLFSVQNSMSHMHTELLSNLLYAAFVRFPLSPAHKISPPFKARKVSRRTWRQERDPFIYPPSPYETSHWYPAR